MFCQPLLNVKIVNPDPFFFLMTMSKSPWRHAATLLIAKRASSYEIQRSLAKPVQNREMLRMLNGSVLPDQGYKLLMLKRAKKMAWPNSYVFPGGVIDKADFSSRWWDVFKKRGPSSTAEINTIIRNDESRPNILKASTYTYTDESANDVHKLPPEVALRLSAIRETFEECGVLIARRNAASLQETTSVLRVDDTKMWQERVQKNASQMMQLCLELDCCPDVWALHEWSAWLTPALMNPRFETVFFICTLNDKPELQYSPVEVSNHLWCSPLEFLSSYANKEIWLPPPQIYELSRLLNLNELDLLEEFARKRQCNALVTLFPVKAHSRDGMLHLLPGDDLYPADPDVFGNTPVMSYNHSLQELEDDALYLNRLSFDDSNMWKLVCNVDLRDGHKKPVSLRGCLLTSNL